MIFEFAKSTYSQCRFFEHTNDIVLIKIPAL